MQAGNRNYRGAGDIPESIAVFPVAGALLLPGTRLPLNIFEPRYLEMIDHVIGGERLIGMIQPRLDGATRADGEPELCEIGCLGRLTSFAETGDGRYLIGLQGICRFRVVGEAPSRHPFRQCRILPFAADLSDGEEGLDIDRQALIRTFRAYLQANELKADWESVSRADTATLVNVLSIMAPYGPAEKQALLEAPDIRARADTLIALTEFALARGGDDSGPAVQ